jgi:2-dehydro-3-deoxyphosphooctonate aldolase (KDO 8-P synthase)
MKLSRDQVGNDKPLFLIAGPCVIESRDMVFHIAETMKRLTEELAIPYVFKASFDKANRTSHTSFRGVGITRGLEIFSELKREFGLDIITDVHEDTPLDEVAEVVDILQTPAFLCRQTNFMQRVAKTGLPINIKKGQFLAPWDMQPVVDKMRAAGNDNLWLCERGASFGYNNLVSDMRSLAVMKQTGCPVVFDATHSVQLPGGQGSVSGGQRQFVPVLARAAVAVGVAGVFMETHPNPNEAKSDGPNSWPLGLMRPLLENIQRIDEQVKGMPLNETSVSEYMSTLVTE